MGKIKNVELTEFLRVQLESGFRTGTSHCFRMRCRVVLLKAAGLSSAKAGEQAEMSLISVNAWVKHFLSENIAGLQTRFFPDAKKLTFVSKRVI
jgi:predicted HicB family RNase H-like nuclease